VVSRWRLRLPSLLPGLAVGALVAGLLPVAAASATAAAPPLSRLVEIRAATHPDYDRVVFELEGRVPAYRVRWTDRLVAGGSGDRVPVPGRALLEVVLHETEAHDAGGPTVSHRNTFALPNVMSVIRGSDFEGVVNYGIGLTQKTSYRTFTLTHPSRVVVDIAKPRTVWKRVYMIDEDRVVENQTPYTRYVLRPVLPLTPATGVMDRLFAGPTPLEAEQGLRVPTYPSPTRRSGATGFADLSIRDGVARVRLTGGCSSGGSTVTIADEIIPTLKQFDTVRWVKIYDPQGRTADPTGSGDSIPACLEP
jgi:Fe-S cluster biogenesis protein NfuA